MGIHRQSENNGWGFVVDHFECVRGDLKVGVLSKQHTLQAKTLMRPYGLSMEVNLSRCAR